MLNILGFFWRICLLKAGPESLPSSNFVTGFVFTLYFARPREEFVETLVIVATGLLVQAGMTFTLTSFKGHRQRFRATWTALIGTNAFMLIVLLPFSLIIVNVENQTLKLFADSAWWICFGWWLAIAGHIYHRAVNVSVLLGSAIAFMTEMLSVFITLSIFPGS
jgi:hypothetical protein